MSNPAFASMRPHSPSLADSVRLRWNRIDWTQPMPADAPVFPDTHAMLPLGDLQLRPSQQLGLNRLMACFTCELFIHFEGYVIRYLTRTPERVPPVAPSAIERFVEEERVHSEMFHRLLHKLRPDLYAAPSERTPLRFLRWQRGDDVALALTPVGTFFLLAWLFEEITLFVPRAIDQNPSGCASLVSDVMRLHAREELPHVALDARILSHLTQSRRRWITRAETTLALPLLVYVDATVQRAWSRVVLHARDELGLSASQCRLLRARGPSQSDRWGTQSFLDKVSKSDLAGAPLLCWALQRAMGAPRGSSRK